MNSFLLYKMTVQSPKTHLFFRRMLVEQAAKLSIQQGPPRSGPGAPRRQPSNNVPQRLERQKFTT